MRIKFEEIDKQRIEKYLELRKQGFKLKKTKQFRDEEKSKNYVEFISNQIRKRKNKFRIKLY